MAVKTIPNEFYAGANPVIEFKEVQRTISVDKDSKSILSADEKKAFEKATVAGGKQKWHPANLLSNRKFLIIGGVILFVGMGLGTWGYYWRQNQKNVINQPQPSPSDSAVPIVVQSTTLTEPIVISPVEENPPVEIQLSPALLMEFPSSLLGESADDDNDNITNLAEELFNTDPFNSDSDGDKYPDGHELFYLYNPSGFEPRKLIDSGFVKEFINPTYDYKIYYPANWDMGNVDPIYQQILFSTLTGENIEVHEFNLESGQTFADWLALAAPQEKLSDLVNFSSYFNVPGKKRVDGLVYYFQDNQRLFVLAFHTTNSSVVNYKIVLEIMARSFRFGETIVTAPPIISASQLPEVMAEIVTGEALIPENLEESEEVENPVGL